MPGVALGWVVGAHGVHGAVRAKLFNAESSTLAPGQTVDSTSKTSGFAEMISGCERSVSSTASGTG